MAPLEVRRLTAADHPALSDEVDRARAAGDFRVSSDADAEYFLKSFDLDPGIVAGAFDGDEIVGFVSADYKVAIVRPDRRRQGIGRALVAAELGGERARGRDQVVLGAMPDDAGAKAFLAATGFAFHSTLWDLALPPTASIGEPVWPEGHESRAFDRTRDVQPWIDLFNAAFADHATPLQLDAAMVTAGLDDPAIHDADTGLVVETATGELVGFCATAPIRRDGVVQPHGEIWTIGVRPDRPAGGTGTPAPPLGRPPPACDRRVRRVAVGQWPERARAGAVRERRLRADPDPGALVASDDRRQRRGAGPLSNAGDSGLPAVLAAIASRPRLAALLGATCIAFSGIFYRWAEVSPSTGTVFRALFGLPLLLLVAWLEHRRYGGLPVRTVRLALFAGVFFAGDLLFWHHAIEYVGAGLATVLGNLQVIIVGRRGVAGLRRAAEPQHVPRPAGRARRRRVDLRRDRRRGVRQQSGPRGRVRARDGVLLRRLSADHPARRTRSASAGRSGGDRDDLDGRGARPWPA